MFEKTILHEFESEKHEFAKFLVQQYKARKKTGADTSDGNSNRVTCDDFSIKKIRDSGKSINLRIGHVHIYIYL